MERLGWEIEFVLVISFFSKGIDARRYFFFFFLFWLLIPPVLLILLSSSCIGVWVMVGLG